MKDALLIIRDQLTMGYKLSFAEAMLLQQAIDVAVSQAGNSPVIPEGYKLVPVESNDAWAERYCELTNKHPDGGLTTYIGDGAVTITFREKSKREIDAMLAAAPTPTKAEAQQISPIKPVLFANDFDLKNGWADHADTVTEARQGYTVPLYAAPLLLDEIKDHKFNSGDKADDYHAGY